MLTFVLPRPPSTNGLFANIRGVGRVKSAEYKQWLADVGWIIKSATAALPADQRRIGGPFSVSIRAGGDKRRPDIDNVIKPILDALVAAEVVDDDRHCQSVSAAWSGAGRNCVVEIKPAEMGAGAVQERAA